MEIELQNGLSDSQAQEPPKVSGRSRKKSPKRSSGGQGKGAAKKPEPRLSEIDFLLSLWQHDCAELQQAGVELHLSVRKENGVPIINLKLYAVAFCPKCEMPHGTKMEHICIR